MQSKFETVRIIMMYLPHMFSFHDDAVKASALLFNKVFGDQGLSAEPGPKNGGPDLAIFYEGKLSGLGEVKTLVNEEKTKLASGLYGKKKTRFWTELPEDAGHWSMQVELGADISRGRRILEKFLVQKHEHEAEDLVFPEDCLNRLGFQFLRRHPDSAADGLTLNALPAGFSPIERGIDPNKLYNFFREKHSHKEAVRAVQNFSGPHRHIFLWPCETEFPGEVFAANEFPTVLPLPMRTPWDGFTHLWIGHKYPMSNHAARAWMLSDANEWVLVAAE
jgi:hypothetical protein